MRKIRKEVEKKKKIFSYILLLITPVITFWTVQMITLLSARNYVQGLKPIKEVIKRLFMMNTKYLLYNLVIYYVIFGIIILIFRKVKIAAAAYMVLMVILALVNYYVLMFRGQAFMLLDILGMGTAAEVAGSYEFKVSKLLLLTLLGAVVFVVFQFIFQKLELGKKGKRNLICRLCGLLVIIGVLWGSYPLTQKLENVYLWNLNEDHVNKGYAYTLLCEMRYFSVEKPDNYSKDSLDEITEKYADLKDDSDKETDNSKGSDKSEDTVQATNIIMIMNESLTDFESLGEVKSNKEILPYIRSMNQNVKHGHLQMPTFGGGTSRSEYEALTGNCLQFLPSGCAPYQLYVRDSEYGMADILKAQGYETIAMHPNKAANWNRETVYKSMGFDQFLNLSNWGSRWEKIRNFCSDESLFNKIIELYEDKEEGQKRFTFCVTMQNHGGYKENNSNGYQPDVKLDYDTKYPQAETYLSLARQSDIAFKNLIEYFENVDEPTMIVMFGDHWPKIESGFETEVLGKDLGSLDLVENQQLYKTPYVIWTNYPSETVEEDTSSNYLGSYVMQLAGVEMPEYNQFLMKLKEEIPVIGMGAVCDSDGNWYDMENLPKKYQELLNEYQIMEYNAQFEKKDIREDLFRLSN